MTDKINPAWKPLLDKIPPEYHNQILPDLQAWDKGVQDQFTKIHADYEEYKPFKQFVDNNIDAEYAMQSVMLADQLQREPEKVIAQVNEAWELGFVSKEEASKLGQPAGESTDTGDLFTDDGDDILKNPKVKAMADALEQLQQTYETDKKTKAEQEAEDAAIAQFESDLDALEEKYTKPAEGDPLPFNRMFVTALMAQGVEGDEAVKQYHQILAGAVTTDTKTETDDSGKPPVVMGNGGTVGSGVGDGSVDYGKMTTSDFNDTVEQLIAAAQQSGQG